MAISVYESLMAFRIGSVSPVSENISQNILSLFKGYQRFVEYLKKFSKPKKGKGKKDKDKDGNDTTIKKGGRPPILKLPNTILDLDIISKSMILLYE